MTRRPLLSLALLACLTLAACESKVTTENYDKVTNGMTRSQVEKILGRGKDDTSHAGTSISGAGIAESSRTNDTVYVWEDASGGKIIITFQDDKVVQKSKVGMD